MHQEASAASVLITSRRYPAALAVLLVLLSIGSIQAESTFKSVPGLLHGRTPGVLIDQLVPAFGIVEQPLAPVSDIYRDPTGFRSTTALDAVAGPVGVSRFLGTAEDPDCDEFWGTDKWRHVGVWFAGTLGFYLFFKTVFKTSKLVSYLLSGTIMTVLGVAREISDSNSEKNCFSEQDILANTLGILAVGVVITIF